MLKPFKAIKVFGILFVMLIVSVCFKGTFYAASASDVRNGIVPDKNWTVTFSKNVSYNFVNSNYIFVKDSFGNNVEITSGINPANLKQVIVKPKYGKYTLGKTYILTIKAGFQDENGNALKQDRVLNFTIKNQLVDTATFNVQVNPLLNIAGVRIKSLSTSKDIKYYYIEDNLDGVDKYAMNDEIPVHSNSKNVNVYFYDSNGDKVGSSILNVAQANANATVEIKN